MGLKAREEKPAFQLSAVLGGVFSEKKTGSRSLGFGLIERCFQWFSSVSTTFNSPALLTFLDPCEAAAEETCIRSVGYVLRATRLLISETYVTEVGVDGCLNFEALFLANGGSGLRFLLKLYSIANEYELRFVL